MGKLGADPDYENQREFRNGFELTEVEKKRVVAEVLRLGVELMFSTHLYSFARACMYPIRAGWRWKSGGLWYREEWEEKDALLSPTERTKRAVHGSMQGLTKCLRFTVETSEDFADGWLPTLGKFKQHH